ncbi:MAG: hypothetical protein NTY75_02460 [Candidatus Shapirobacteria bacterium]|nr:hypothetical protein [Candidatus Shapirobacteria bacterium]
MNPIFKNYSDSARQLFSRVKEESINPIFTYINPDAKNYCLLVSSHLVEFSEIRNLKFVIRNLVILDDGSTNSVEFNEYTDRIRESSPTTKIIIAIPVIPESEKATLESVCDTLIYLHAEPLFFSINQFYQSNT